MSDKKDNESKKSKKRRKINWREYNESLVRRGEVMFDTNFLSNWQTELKGMNKGKEGAKYRYPNSLILLLATVHACLLPYRQLEGFLRVLSKHMVQLREEVPDFTTMWWRVVRVKVELNPEVNLEGEKVMIVVDATGIKVSNRGEWIREKWRRQRRGFIKIHVAVNIKTKRILSMKVTKEDIMDGKMLKPLISDAASSSSSSCTITKVIADGAYDSKDNFKYLDQMEIEPVIRVRKNSSTKANNGCIPRKSVVVEQLKDRLLWKKKHRYCLRLVAESAFSSIKRTFGEYVSSVKWNNIVNELLLKASIYNMFISKMTV